MTDPVEDYCADCGVYGALPLRHDEDCPRWRPPARGPGSTDEGRARARALWHALRTEARTRKEMT